MLRLYLIGGASALALFAGLALWARHEHAVAERAKAEAQTATRQAQLNDATAQAVDHLQTRTVIVREKADAASKAVERAPGSETPIPPDVLSAWRAGIDGLRDAGDGGSPDNTG